MFNIGSGELVLIAVVALLVLGPKRLPELARGLGKFLREFRRQTDEVRNVVEREFYKMDKEMDGPPPPANTPWHPPTPELSATAAPETIATTTPGGPVAAPLTDEEDHKLLVPADPDPVPVVNQHLDPPPAHPEAAPPVAVAPALAAPASPDAASVEPAKKAS